MTSLCQFQITMQNFRAEIQGEITQAGLHDKGAINLDVIEESEDSDSMSLQAKIKKNQDEMEIKKEFK